MKINKFVKSLFGWIIYIAVLIALIYGIPKALVYILDTQHPMASITSGSMWPALKKGDLIFIKGIENKDEIKIGDIVVYKNSKGFTVHRVIEINEDTIVTRGDANNVNDTPISYEEIIGRPLTIKDKPFRIPFVGMVSVLMNKNKI